MNHNITVSTSRCPTAALHQRRISGGRARVDVFGENFAWEHLASKTCPGARNVWANGAPTLKA